MASNDINPGRHHRSALVDTAGEKVDPATSGAQATANAHLANVAARLLNGSDSAAALLDAINTALASLATAANQGPYTATLAVWRAGVTSTSATLATLKGAAVAAGVQEVLLVPHSADDTITLEEGAAATTNSARLPAYGVSLPVDKTLADTLQLWTASGTKYVTVIELG